MSNTLIYLRATLFFFVKLCEIAITLSDTKNSQSNTKKNIRILKYQILLYIYSNKFTKDSGICFTF